MTRATLNSSPSNNHHFVSQDQFTSHLNSCTNSHHFVIPLTPSYFSLHQSFPYSLTLSYSLSPPFLRAVLTHSVTFLSHVIIFLCFPVMAFSKHVSFSSQLRSVSPVTCQYSHTPRCHHCLSSIQYRDPMAFGMSARISPHG